MKNQTKKNRQGYSLVEILLAVGLVTILSVGGYAFFGLNSSSAQARAEQNRIHEIALGVESSYGATGGYGGITTAKVLQDKLVDNQLLQEGTLKTNWGQSISITPQTIAKSNDGFMVTYPATPSEVCVKLVPALSTRAYRITVNNVRVQNGEEDTLLLSQMVSSCGAAKTVRVDFVFYTPSASGLVASDPLELPSDPVVPTTPPTPTVPVKDPDPINNGGDATNPGVVTPTPIPSLPAPSIPALPNPDPPSTVTPPTAPVPPVVTPPVIVPPNVCSPSESNAERICAANMYGIQVWNTKNICGTWDVPEAWAPITTSTTMTSNTCQNCPGAATGEEYQWTNTTQYCAAGQYGVVNWQRQQRRTRSVTYNCPAGTRTLPGPTYGGWSGWGDTGANQGQSGSCNNCPGDENRPAEEWRGGSRACTNGQQGTESYEYLVRMDRTYRYNCPAGTVNLPGAVEVWNSGWYGTGAERNINRAGCSTPGLIATDLYGHLAVGPMTPNTATGPVSLKEKTTWTYLWGQSGEWPFSYGPMRGSASATVTFNGVSQGVSGQCNTSGTSSSQTCKQGPWTYDFGGRQIEFEFRGSSNPNYTTISGSAGLYYRFK